MSSVALATVRRVDPASPWITFLSTREGEREIYRINADGTHLKRLTFGFQIDYIPTWSPTGEWMTYAVSRRSPPQIYIGQLDSPHVTIVPAAGYQVQPSWSPDGKWITYSSNNSGPYEIYRTRVDGSERYRMTNSPNSDWNPIWSPDSRWIVFESENAGNRDLFIIPSDNIALDTDDAGLTAGEQEGFNLDITTEEEPAVVIEEEPPPPASVDPIQLTTEEGRDWQSAWSPDSQWIVYVSDRDGNAELYKMHPDGSHITRLTFNEVIDAYPDWSPDGRWILFESDRDGNRELYKMHPDGSHVTRLTFDDDIDHKAQWSPIVNLPWHGIIPIIVGLICFALPLYPLRKFRYDGENRPSSV